MANDLLIDLLEATIDAADPQAQRRAERILHGVVEGGLDRALASDPLPDGEWCIREVDAIVPDSNAASELTVAEQWSQALIDAVRRTIERGGPGVVHYRDRRAALVDLVRGLALGRRDRVWAWRQLDLVDGHGDELPRPGEAVVAALEREPALALGVLTEAAGDVGVHALDRLLGVACWQALAVVVATAAGAPASAARALVTEATTARRSAANDANDRSWSPGSDAARSAVVDVLQRSPLARSVAGSPLRPDRARALALAVLCVAGVEPRVLRSSMTAEHLVSGVAEAFRYADRPTPSVPRLVQNSSAARDSTAATGADDAGRASPGCATHRDGMPSAVPAAQADRATDVPAATADERSATADERSGDADGGDADERSGNADGGHADGDRADRRQSWPTPWAGLLFLLRVIDAFELHDLTDTALARRPLGWVLHQLAGELVPIADDDPARRVFAGTLPDEPSAAAGALPPDAGELAAIRSLAVHVRAHLPLPADGDDPALAVCARGGFVLAEPGWVDVHLPLSSVDVGVRAAGLDLDPGWIPWLGIVVRFLYG